MNTEELVSIIVPIYNVEKYLNECVESIVAQTYKNIEIILVDDGSTDSCGLLCDQWREKDLRIKVIHKKNGGLSDARNAGIEQAAGKYISFIDSDDIIDSRMIEILYCCFDKYPHLNVAACGYKEVVNKGQCIYNSLTLPNPVLLTGKEAIMLMLDSSKAMNVVAWNKLYTKACFEKMRYPKGYNHEDMYVTPRILYESEKVCYVDVALYFHRYNPTGIVNSKYTYKSQDEILGVESMREYFSSIEYKEALKKTNRVYLWKLIDHTVKSHLYLHDRKNENRIINKYRTVFQDSIRNIDCSGTDVCQFWLFFFLPKCYIFIRKKKYRGK